MPTEGFQGLLDELAGLRFVKAAFRLEFADQLLHPRREDVAIGQNAGGEFTQFGVINQFEAKQGREHPEWADLQGVLMHGTEGRGVDRYTGRAEIVVANWLHAHDCEQAANGGQLFRRADPDCTMPLHRQTTEFAGPAQLLFDLGGFFHHLAIGFRDQVQ
ncbi:hypothetical protein D3C84_758080 [compost metagenome]